MVDKKDKPKVIDGNKSKPSKKESKTDSFLRIAVPRVKGVLRTLRILGNCSNRSNYEYTSEQIEKMFETIYEMVSNVQAKFTLSKQESEAFEF